MRRWILALEGTGDLDDGPRWPSQSREPLRLCMRTMMVASTGGHLTELYTLRRRLEPAPDSLLWVTFDTSQSRALLAGEEVVMIPHVAPRDYKGVIAALGPARRLLRDSRAERVVSTGAAVAMAFLPSARQLGLSSHYIESAARIAGPSATGRLLQRLGAGSLYTQHPGWATGRWSYGGSVFDGFAPVAQPGEGQVKRVLVSLGTSPFPFPRLVEQVARLIPPNVDIVWQSGSTADRGLPGHAIESLSHDELLAEMARADVVVSHAGVGNALAALSVGKCPVLVPRRADRAEHVDDHQSQIAGELATRGLAVTADASALRVGHLEQAALVSAQSVEEAPAFRLRDKASTHGLL